MKTLVSLLVAISLLANVSPTFASFSFLLATTTHCGNISANQTWSNSTIHLITCDTLVNNGITLTIQPGVIVKLGGGSSLIIDGTLRAVGTTSQPIYFTSERDDTLGGDTNGDGSSTTASPGNWDAIEFRNSSNDANTIIDHAVISYGGRFTNGNVTFTGASPRVQNSTFSNSYSAAIYADLVSSPTLLANVYDNNGWNGIHLVSGTIATNMNWNILDAPYIITQDVFVGVGSTLTIQPGVIVKLGGGSSLMIDGTLRAVGTPAKPINFTSIQDDTLGGDTNGDGSSTTPSRGNWDAIEFRNPSNDANSIIENAVLSFGGRFVGGILTLTDASPTIRYSSFKESYSAGIWVNNASPVLVCNNIHNNQFGLRNQTVSTVINAAQQWWGDPSGPYHVSLNPNGKGNEVSQGVTFTPWRSSQCVAPALVLKLKVYLPLTLQK